MKKLLMAAAAIPLATFAVEASAQQNVNANAALNLQNRIVQLETRLNTGIQSGAVDRAEAQALRQQIRSVRQLERQYSANGLTQAERQAVQQRIRAVNQQIRTAYGRSPYNDRDDFDTAYGGNVVYDQYGRPIATGSVAYDQYGRPVATGGVAYDQYGRPIATNGYVGQGGPYYPQQTYPQQGGIGNVLGGGGIGSVLGGGGIASVLSGLLGGRSLGVGDVITSAIGNVLGGVPSGYQSQYQSRGNTYFRSDGQQVYEIDARTNQVIRIHPLR